MRDKLDEAIIREDTDLDELLESCTWSGPMSLEDYYKFERSLTEGRASD